jgi:hypothetical protein
MELPDEPEWAPLEAVALVSRLTSDLPSFHPGEFMYMYMVRNPAKRLRIHLYKHIDTRRYLNLDDGGRAYEYVDAATDDELDDNDFGGYYRPHRDLAEAVMGLGLRQFDSARPLYRSFPPEDWPSDEPITSPVVPWL